MSQNEALRSDFQHPFKWKVQLPAGPGDLHRANQGRPMGPRHHWASRMTGYGRFFLPAREDFKVQVTPQTARRHWRGTKQNPCHLLGTRPAHPEWSCLGTCQCRCQRPTQPKEGERIKQRIRFLFSCKKHLPLGYKCYCICVALYCCPQLASITWPQWQYFYNPWSIAYFYRLQSQLPIRSV